MSSVTLPGQELANVLSTYLMLAFAPQLLPTARECAWPVLTFIPFFVGRSEDVCEGALWLCWHTVASVSCWVFSEKLQESTAWKMPPAWVMAIPAEAMNLYDEMTQYWSDKSWERARVADWTSSIQKYTRKCLLFRSLLDMDRVAVPTVILEEDEIFIVFYVSF